MAGMWNTVEVGKSVSGYELSDLVKKSKGESTDAGGRVVTSNVSSGETAVMNEGDTSKFGEASELGKSDFLNLLVTQLRYQDPMAPQADTEFVAQLAQYSSLETNKNIETAMSSLSENMNNFMTLQTVNSASTVNASSTNLIGKSVRVGYSEVEYAGSAKGLNILLDEGVTTGYVQVKNSSGEVISCEQFTAEKGKSELSYSWDGLKDDDIKAPYGKYTVEVLDASKMKAVGAIYTDGKVEGLRYTSDGMRLTVGGKTFAMKDLMTVNA